MAEETKEAFPHPPPRTKRTTGWSEEPSKISNLIVDMGPKYKSDRCFNPLKRPHKKISARKLRKVSPEMLKEWRLPFEQQHEMRICDTCRKKMKEIARKASPSPKINDDSDTSEESVPPVCSFVESDSEVDIELVQISSPSDLNKTLLHIRESPVVEKTLRRRKYVREKLGRVEKSIRREFFHNLRTLGSSEGSKDDGESIILENLKQAYSKTEDRDKKIKILTVLPANWSYNKIKEHFNATTHMIKTAKEYAREGFIL